MSVKQEPVIVITIFGSSAPEGIKNIEDVDNLVLKRYPGADVRWALTSEFILKKLRLAGRNTMFARRVPVLGLGEVYESLRREGKTRVSLQSLLVMSGSEYNTAISTPAEGLEVEYGYPLLAPPDNIERVVRALEPLFGGPETANLICSHGNAKFTPANAPLLLMGRYVRKHYRNVYLVTLEGPPGTDEAFAEIKKAGYKRVKFIPLLIIAGEHIAKDIMGDGSDSYKTRLGLPATAETGMGSSPAVMHIWAESIDWTRARLEGK